MLTKWSTKKSKALRLGEKNASHQLVRNFKKKLLLFLKQKRGRQIIQKSNKATERGNKL